MNFLTDNKPIIACSTGNSSNTAIAVIRFSGFKNLFDLQPFFSFNLTKVKKRYSHLTNIIFKNAVIDNVILIFFPEGESYTGENVLEISVHGNQLNISRILDLFTTHSLFRLAYPGEFTYRALKNNKLSLSQVEGLDMLLNANSSLMLSQGLDLLQGELHNQYMKLYNSFIQLKSAVEISIDFSDDLGDEETKVLFNKSYTEFTKILNSLHARTQGNISSLLSPEVVLFGQTNAGKSSLFNLLIQENRSIVSNIAGTTRDYISEIININGSNFKLVDTAGIRDTNDLIEGIGIDRSFMLLDRSFFKILLINPFELNHTTFSKFNSINFDLVIISHSDKDNFSTYFSKINFSDLQFINIVAANFLTGSIEPVSLNGPIEPVDSSINNAPIEPKRKSLSGSIEPFLLNEIENKFKKLTVNNPILNERHRECINKIYLRNIDLSSKIRHLNDVAILSSEVNIFSTYLSDLIGIISPDDVLNSIFSNFCIGK